MINTCAVTGESVRKSPADPPRTARQSAGKLVVSGCYASLETEAIAAELGVDLVVANPDKDRLIDIAARRLDLPVMPETATEPARTPAGARPAPRIRQGTGRLPLPLRLLHCDQGTW